MKRRSFLTKLITLPAAAVAAVKAVPLLTDRPKINPDWVNAEYDVYFPGFVQLDPPLRFIAKEYMGEMVWEQVEVGPVVKIFQRRSLSISKS